MVQGVETFLLRTQICDLKVSNLTLVCLPHECGGAHDGDLQEARQQLPLGGHVDDEGEVDQGDRAEDGTGHAQAQGAAHHLLWAWVMMQKCRCKILLQRLRYNFDN